MMDYGKDLIKVTMRKIERKPCLQLSPTDIEIAHRGTSTQRL